MTLIDCNCYDGTVLSATFRHHGRLLHIEAEMILGHVHIEHAAWDDGGPDALQVVSRHRDEIVHHLRGAVAPASLIAE